MFSESMTTKPRHVPKNHLDPKTFNTKSTIFLTKSVFEAIPAGWARKPFSQKMIWPSWTQNRTFCRNSPASTHILETVNQERTASPTAVWSHPPLDISTHSDSISPTSFFKLWQMTSCANDALDRLRKIIVFFDSMNVVKIQVILSDYVCLHTASSIQQENDQDLILSQRYDDRKRQ